MEKKPNHFDENGKAVMVDVGEKPATHRSATAAGTIYMGTAAFAALQAGSAEKGDVLGVARIAGIMAVKQTAALIPLCHPIATEKAAVDFTLLPQKSAIQASCTVHTHGKTGVEMEALCGVSTALLTIYDMLKALDRSMEIGEIHLLEKQGGQSGHYLRGRAAQGMEPQTQEQNHEG